MVLSFDYPLEYPKELKALLPGCSHTEIELIWLSEIFKFLGDSNIAVNFSKPLPLGPQKNLAGTVQKIKKACLLLTSVAQK